MTASSDAVRRMADVLLKYLDQPMAEQLMIELQKIEGNSSFKATVLRLADEVLKRRKLKSVNR